MVRTRDPLGTAQAHLEVDDIRGHVLHTHLFGHGHPKTAQLASPSGVALDGAGNLFIADWDNDRIRRVAGVAVPVTVWPGIGPGR